ncbi:putative high affinity copper protein [Poronia punctata]|nr:putative high affinity copper protein [Poronia punctata]
MASRILSLSGLSAMSKSMDATSSPMGSLPTPTDSAIASGMNATGGPDAANSTMSSAQSMMGTCKISMLWNWETINACFLSKSWQIHSRGAFAALCLGVIGLVVFLEFLRRLAKTYDQHLVRQHQLAGASLANATSRASSALTATGSLIPKESPMASLPFVPLRPSVGQQAVRALLHTLQFATAYWIMLLAMYYNGYIIICIVIGAFIGSFIFHWERIEPR